MIQLGTMIVSVLTFLIMYLLIKRYGFKPLAEMLEKRRVHISTEITEAESSRRQAELLLAEQRQLLEHARNEAKQIVDVARTRADAQAHDILQTAQTEAERLLEEGRERISRERDEAMNSVFTQVSTLAVNLSTKLLHNHVTPAVHDDMLLEADKSLGELVC